MAAPNTTFYSLFRMLLACALPPIMYIESRFIVLSHSSRYPLCAAIMTQETARRHIISSRSYSRFKSNNSP